MNVNMLSIHHASRALLGVSTFSLVQCNMIMFALEARDWKEYAAIGLLRYHNGPRFATKPQATTRQLTIRCEHGVLVTCK